MTQKQSKSQSGSSPKEATLSSESSSARTHGKTSDEAPIHPRHSDPSKQRVIDKTIEAGQRHVLRWWSELSAESKERLLQQLSHIDFEELNELYRARSSENQSSAAQEIELADVIALPKNKRESARHLAARGVGQQALAAGEVAVFVVAGGQATRLGVDVPKGTLKITPIKHKSIFQHHVEKILALSKRHGQSLPFYIMTSETNDQPTREFFEKNGYFGLKPDDVFFFQQDMMPALDFDGKLILDAKDHIFTSPNGHGGCIGSLHRSGALKDMKRRGIKYIFYFQVDNVLIKIADPVFLGYHIQEQAEMSAKVTPKRDPEEKVGVICRAGGKTMVIEYSDLPDVYRYATNPDGSLKFSAGSIAIHILNVDLVERLDSRKRSLPFHIAEKAIPHLTPEGHLVKARKKNGLKFEMFVFDALTLAKKTVVMEVDRNEEFAPVKNAEGEDSPHTARELMTRLYAKWLMGAAAIVPLDISGNIMGAIEISPLFALDADELKKKIPSAYQVHTPLYLGPDR